MLVWRICRKPYARDALTGRGSLLTSGRWHTAGRPVVYTAQSLSLAALEYLVHVDRDLVPDDLVRVEIEIPEGLRIRRIGPKDLPRSWRSYPGPVRLRRIGDQWMEDRKSPVLQVPSVLIPEERNYLINPGHPAAGKIRKLSTKSFAYDSRL